MQIKCTLLETNSNASISLHSIFTGRMLFLTPSQQCQSTDGHKLDIKQIVNNVNWKRKKDIFSILVGATDERRASSLQLSSGQHR